MKWHCVTPKFTKEMQLVYIHLQRNRRFPKTFQKLYCALHIIFCSLIWILQNFSVIFGCLFVSPLQSDLKKKKSLSVQHLRMVGSNTLSAQEGRVWSLTLWRGPLPWSGAPRGREPWISYRPQWHPEMEMTIKSLCYWQVIVWGWRKRIRLWNIKRKSTEVLG